MTAPTDNLIRAVSPGVELRADDTDDEGLPTLFGHFAVFDEWTEIDSAFEGRFLERIKPGAFRDTFAEDRASMKVLYDHGHDPVLGNKPLGPLEDLREDKRGAYYEVGLIDTDYNRGFIIPAVEAGLLGASFRFSVRADEWTEEPDPSDHNPRGLPERTITDLRNYEMGPVTFPAYGGTDQGLRSATLTDHYIDRLLTGGDDGRARALSMYPSLRTLLEPGSSSAEDERGGADATGESDTPDGNPSHARAAAVRRLRLPRKGS